MKRSLPNSSVLVSLVLTAITFFSCTKQQMVVPENENETIVKVTQSNIENTSSLIASTTPFTRRAGAFIDARTTNRWINNLKASNKYVFNNLKNAGAYVLQQKDIRTILSNPSCVGICFYNGIDNAKKVHVLPVGIDASGKEIKTASVNTQSGLISWARAKQWIANYKGPIKGYFWGSNMLTQLNCSFIKASFALNDYGGQELLLSDASVLSASISLDDSVKCPPFCPRSEP